MSTYNLSLENHSLELSGENCDYFLNDDVNEIDLDTILTLLQNSTESLQFEKEYYSEYCDNCQKGKGEKKVFDFIEGHFFIFTKNNNFIISDLSEKYKSTSFKRLLKSGEIDDSYIVKIIVCPYCDNYSIEIEQCSI